MYRIASAVLSSMISTPPTPPHTPPNMCKHLNNTFQVSISITILGAADIQKTEK